MIRLTDMRQDFHDLSLASCAVLAFGEPTHREPAFGWLRNEMFAGPADLGFRSIALESDRVAALRIDDFVMGGDGDLDDVAREGLSPRLREPGDQPAPHRLDARPQREPAPAGAVVLPRLRCPDGDDQRPQPAALSRTRPGLPWARPRPRRAVRRGRAVESDGGGDGPGHVGRRHARGRPAAVPRRRHAHPAPLQRSRADRSDLARAEWLRAKTHLTAGLGLLRYHRQAAQRLESNARLSRLFATRDALMAQNLLDIRSIEGRRGATLVFGHNVHLQRTPSAWSLGDLNVSRPGGGTVVAPLLGEQYVFIAGSLAAARISGWTTPNRARTRAPCRTASPIGAWPSPARSQRWDLSRVLLAARKEAPSRRRRVSGRTRVSASRAVVSQAGGVLLVETARKVGLDTVISAKLGRTGLNSNGPIRACT